MNVNGYELDNIEPKDIKPNDFLLVSTFYDYGYGEPYKYLAKASKDYSENNQIIYKISNDIDSRDLNNVIQLSNIIIEPLPIIEVFDKNSKRRSYSFMKIEKRFIDDLISYRLESLDVMINKYKNIKRIFKLNIEKFNRNEF